MTTATNCIANGAKQLARTLA